MARFQSTLPYGSETVAICSLQMTSISIHAPLRERTFAQIIISREGNFNPRSLTGATVSDEILRTSLGFQSTLPYGSDLFVRHLCFRDTIFQSTLPYGSDVLVFRAGAIAFHFNPRSLTGAKSLQICLLASVLFQSTLPYGSDLYLIVIFDDV